MTNKPFSLFSILKHEYSQLVICLSSRPRDKLYVNGLNYLDFPKAVAAYNQYSN